MSVSGTSPDTALDLYKMEYERAAQRYDDIYRAAWTNFSYLTVVAGAIITFGKDSFGTERAAFLACLPLFFWYLASFVPLNRYGDLTVGRLKDIEAKLNGDHGTTLSHYTNFLTVQRSRLTLRVRPVVWLFFFVLYCTTTYLLWEGYQASSPLQLRDLKNPSGLAQRLQVSKRPIDRYVRSQLSPEFRRWLTRYRQPAPPTIEFQRSLVIQLNRIVEDGVYYGLDLPGLRRTYPTEIAPTWQPFGRSPWAGFFLVIWFVFIGWGMLLALLQAIHR